MVQPRNRRFVTEASGPTMFAALPNKVPSIARQVLYSTDMDTDPGDLGAARMLMYYEKAGFLDVLAVGVDRNTPTGAAVMEAFCRNSGRVYQIGAVSSDVMSQTSVSPTTWHSVVLNQAGANAAHKSSSQYPDAVKLWRHALVNATGPVDIICVGSLAVLYGLMISTGDSISGQTGAQLLNAKAGHLWVMGGVYPTGNEHNFNVGRVAANYVMANWHSVVGWDSADPPCMTLFGYEAGDTVLAHTGVLTKMPVGDMLARAMIDYNVRAGAGPELGRPAWDELLLRIAALGSPAAAGYTTVRGTNAVNSTTADNTFTSSPTGPHQYVVKALSDQAYADIIDAVDVIGQEPIPSGAVWRPDVVGNTVPLLNPSSYPAKPQGFEILGGFHAADAGMLGVVDGGLVETLPSRYGTSGPTWYQGTDANKPTYRAAIGSVPCLQFSGAQFLRSGKGVVHGTDITVIVKARFASIPAAVNYLAAADIGTRVWQMKTDTTGKLQAINFTGGTGRTDSTAALIAANTWQYYVMRYDSTSLEGLIDSTTDGALTTTAPNTTTREVTVGAQHYTALTSALTGYISSFKILKGKATNADLTNLIADM